MKGKKGKKNKGINQKGEPPEGEVNMAEPPVLKKQKTVTKAGTVNVPQITVPQQKTPGEKILERKLTPRNDDIRPDGIDLEDDPQPQPKKKKKKKFEDDNEEDEKPKVSFMDRFSHLKCSREKFKEKDFRVSLGLLVIGFVLWIFGFVMCGQSSTYNQNAPVFVPVLTVFTGINTMIQGYIYLLDFGRKMKYMIFSLCWLLLHFISLIMVSFITIIYKGPQYTVVSSWLLMGVTVSAFFTQAVKQFKRRQLYGKYLYLNIWFAMHSFIVVLLSNLAPIKGGSAGLSVFLHLPMLWWVLYATQSFILQKVAPSDLELQQASQRYMLQENNGDSSVKEMVVDDETMDVDKTYSELIDSRNALARRQAMNSALITKKMDPKTQTRDLADALLKSIKIFGDAFMMHSALIEDERFLDEYEELWTRFQKLSNQLQIDMRPSMIQTLQKVSQEEPFFYTKCYSNLHIGALGYIQSIALINEDRLDEARTCLNTALVAIVTLKTFIGQYRDKLRDNTLILLQQYSKNLEERLKAQQKEIPDYHSSQHEISNKGLGAAIDQQSKKNKEGRYGAESHPAPLTQNGLVSTRIDSFDNGQSIQPTNVKPNVMLPQPAIKEEGTEGEGDYGYEVYEVEEGQEGGEGDEPIEDDEYDPEIMIQQELQQMNQQKQLEPHNKIQISNGPPPPQPNPPASQQNANEDEEESEGELPDIDHLLDGDNSTLKKVEQDVPIEQPKIVVQPPLSPSPSDKIINHQDSKQLSSKNPISQHQNPEIEQKLQQFSGKPGKETKPGEAGHQPINPHVHPEQQPAKDHNMTDDQLIHEELEKQQKNPQKDGQKDGDNKDEEIDDDEDIEFENIEAML